MKNILKNKVINELRSNPDIDINKILSRDYDYFENNMLDMSFNKQINIINYFHNLTVEYNNIDYDYSSLSKELSNYDEECKALFFNIELVRCFDYEELMNTNVKEYFCEKLNGILVEYNEEMYLEDYWNRFKDLMLLTDEDISINQLSNFEFTNDTPNLTYYSLKNENPSTLFASLVY